MSVLFYRGEVIPLDDAAMAAADRARLDYAETHRRNHGAWPAVALQFRVWTREYEAVARRRTMRVVR